TGGDFRRTFELPTEIADAAVVLAANHRRRIDVGRLSFVSSSGAPAHRRFANIASVGVSGVVDRRVIEAGKRPGPLSSMVAAGRVVVRGTRGARKLDAAGDTQRSRGGAAGGARGGAAGGGSVRAHHDRRGQPPGRAVARARARVRAWHRFGPGFRELDAICR